MAVQKQSIPSFVSIISLLSIVFYCAGFLRVELELHEQKKRINALESIAEAKPLSNDPDIIKNAPGIKSSKHHRNSRQVDSTENATEAKGTSEGMLKKNELLLEMMRVQLCQSIGVTCSSGRPGPPGLPGPKGCRGDRGRRGQKGKTGNSGVKGIVGSPGKSGKKGIMGAAGLKGETGTKGEKGDKGPAGMPGPKGNGGPAGVKGTRGDRGTAGLPGSTGPPGSRGYKGDRGRKGEKGRTGEKGNKGTMGPMGLKGETGTKGEKGNLGPEGMPGTKGNKGAAGMPGTKGNKGEAGMLGTKGNKGAAGMPGTKGDKGSRGCKGDRGRKGQKGETGMPGAKRERGKGIPRGIDWCLLLNIICGHGADCVNTDGSYKCECSSGFKQDLDGNCSDLDECITGASDCNDNAECTNTQGSYTCSCKPGFTGDGKKCTETKSSAVHVSSTTNIRETTNVVQSQGSTRSPAQAGGVTSLTIPEARTTAGIEQSRASTMNLSHMSIAAGVLSTSLPLGRTSTVMSSGIEQTLAQTTSLALKSTVMSMNQSMSNVLQSNQSSVSTRASLASSSPIKPLLFTTRVLPYSSNIRTSVSSSGLADNNTSDMTSRSAVMANASKNQNMTHSITVKLDSVQTSMYETSSTMVTLPITSLPPETESSVMQALSSATSIRETTNVVQSQGSTRSLVQAGRVTSKTLPDAWTTAGIDQSKGSAMNLSPMSIAGGVLSTSWPHAMRSAAMSSQTPSIEQSLAQTTSPAHRSISGDGSSTRVQMKQSVSHEVQSNQNSVTTRATAIQHSCTTTTICN